MPIEHYFSEFCEHNFLLGNDEGVVLRLSFRAHQTFGKRCCLAAGTRATMTLEFRGIKDESSSYGTFGLDEALQICKSKSADALLIFSLSRFKSPTLICKPSNVNVL
uniref:Uncharacterized protein n=1 Tax=Romanomermis culicivorax TaxID=13658 RepID=A0A915J3U8_ROMCU